MRFFSLMVLVVVSTVATATVALPHAAADSATKPDMGSAAVDGQKELTGDERAAAISKVEGYLSSINSIVASFTQTSADGSKGDGKFFLKRPGKMRWQYNPPTPLLLVSDGKVVTYYDAGLDQVTYIGVDDTLAGFLAQKNIKLDSESTQLTRISSQNGEISVTIVQKKKPSDGSLTLQFSDRPFEMKQMVAVDATGNATTVKLANAQFGPVLDDKLFVFEDPRAVNRRRNKR